jgi:hypothetical protein
MTATSDIHLKKFITFDDEETTAFSFGILQKVIKSKAQRMVLPNGQTMKDMGAHKSSGIQLGVSTDMLQYKPFSVNDTPFEIEQKKSNNKSYEVQNKYSKELIEDILQLIPDHDIRMISQKPDWNSRETMRYMQDKYSAPDDDQLQYSHQIIKLLEPTESFEDDIQTMQMHIEFLDEMNDPMSNRQQMEALSEVFKSDDAVTTLIEHYVRENPVTRTFKDLTTYIRARIKKAKQGRTGKKFIGQVQSTHDDLLENLTDLIQTHFQQVSDDMKQVKNRLNAIERRNNESAPGHNPLNAPSTVAQPTPATTIDPMYCFFHGQQKTHLGETCREMEPDKIHRTSGQPFTAGMKAATNPWPCRATNGITGNTKGVPPRPMGGGGKKNNTPRK